MTITTDDEDIRRVFEPYCPSNPARLQAITQIQTAGIPACITMTPLLLVSSPYAFADQLLNTRVQKFIAHPFHFQRGKFLAGTRDNAFNLMAEKLGCSPRILQARIPGALPPGIRRPARHPPPTRRRQNRLRAPLLSRAAPKG